MVTLIEYQLSFRDYPVNPLTVNMAGAYDAKHWSRVTTDHGQTLLSLAFNYGVLSMMTLTLGTETLHVELRDSPPGCMADVSDQIKIDSVRRLLMRDLKADGNITTVDSDRVCYETIVDEGGYAKFRHNCCYKDVDVVVYGFCADNKRLPKGRSTSCAIVVLVIYYYTTCTVVLSTWLWLPKPPLVTLMLLGAAEQVMARWKALSRRS